MSILPKPEHVVREAVILIAGALLATLILRQLPGLRAYIKDSSGSCSCGGG